MREYETDDEDVFWDVPRRRLANSHLRRLQYSCLVVSVTVAFFVIVVATVRMYRIFVMAHIWNTQSCCHFKELGIFWRPLNLPLLGTYNVECLGAKMTCCVPQMNRLQRRGVLILTATILIRVMVCSLQCTDFAVCTHWIPQGYERRTAGSRSAVNETCFDSHLSLCLVWKVGRKAWCFHDVRECKLIDSCQVTSFEDVYCILYGRIGHSGGVVPRRE